jgi:hypothetical protein
VGGYLSFPGIDGKARYAATTVADVLPVSLELNDDRVETPEGQLPRVRLPDHPIARGLPTEWPKLLGYSHLHLKPGADLVASVGDADVVLLACAVQDSGRTLAFASDCGPHWCPPDFLAWDGYTILWQRMACWAARRLEERRGLYTGGVSRSSSNDRCADHPSQSTRTSAQVIASGRGGRKILRPTEQPIAPTSRATSIRCSSSRSDTTPPLARLPAHPSHGRCRRTPAARWAN